MKAISTPIILCCALLVACQENGLDPISMNDSIRNDIKLVADKRIFFGHQSVGKNIIKGIQELSQEAGIDDVTIIEYQPSMQLPEHGFLLHAAVGENTKPVSKCLDFQNIINQDLAGKIDIALLKFCYIDINEESDVDELFERYRNILDTLKADHPAITFVHVTAPLRHSEKGAGIWVREMLGKPNRSKLANMKRHQFNELLRSNYNNEPIFDLEASESTYSDGSQNTFSYNDGKDYPNLIGAYTYDGGHLTETGRKKVAADFIRSLANINRSATATSDQDRSD